MKNFDYDIVIIGAGPAGANLARLLNKDQRILLIDGAGEKEKVCGGLLSPDAQDVLARYDICLPKDILASPQLFSVRTVDLSDGLTRYYRRSYMNVNRRKFDEFLLSMVSPHVTVKNLRCTAIRQEKEGFSLSLADGESFTCRFLVGADGASSIVRRTLFREKKIERMTAIQQWFAAGEENANYSCVFDSETSSGCSWIFYKDGNLVFGGAFDFHNSRAMFEKQKEKLMRLGIVPRDAFDTPLRTEACLVSLPRISGGVFFGKDGAYLIGEAAGLISPSSFEGISYALLSAEALADAMNEKTDEKGILAGYQKKAKKLKGKVLARCVKRPFMYQKTLRRAVMKSGITAIKMRKRGDEYGK